MDILIEILLEVYMDLMLLIIPEDKWGRKYRGVATVIAILSLLGIMAMAIWGIVWIVEKSIPWGWLPLTLAVLLSAVQIGMGIVLYNRKHKKK
ncbi:MAG: hypothetical protein IKD15_02870 [Clostridia bacterium]|nr:hypothetical protein [Clostridia bacterium]